MLTHHDLLFGLGLPALIGTVLFLLARRTGGDLAPAESVGRDASPFALVLGYLTAENVLLGPPAIPPTEAAQWLYFGLLALAVLTAIYEGCAGGVWHYYVPISIVVVLMPAIWLLVRPLAENHWSRTESTTWIAGLAMAAMAMTFALDRFLGRQPGLAGSLSLVLVVALAAIVLLLSGTKTYAQLAAGAAAALAPGAVLAAIGRGQPYSRNIVPGFVLVLGGLLLAGHQYASLTAQNALLLLVAPLGLWLGELPVVSRWPRWQRGLLAIAAVALPALLATALAARKFLEQTATGY